MKKYNPEKYQRLVAENGLYELMSFIYDEFHMINKIQFKDSKEIVDIGAGYGRILEGVREFGNYVGIEINPQMFKGLEDRVNLDARNAECIFGDATQLRSIVRRKIC